MREFSIYLDCGNNNLCGVEIRNGEKYITKSEEISKKEVLRQYAEMLDKTIEYGEDAKKLKEFLEQE